MSTRKMFNLLQIFLECHKRWSKSMAIILLNHARLFHYCLSQIKVDFIYSNRAINVFSCHVTQSSRRFFYVRFATLTASDRGIATSTATSNRLINMWATTSLEVVVLPLYSPTSRSTTVSVEKIVNMKLKYWCNIKIKKSVYSRCANIKYLLSIFYRFYTMNVDLCRPWGVPINTENKRIQ